MANRQLTYTKRGNSFSRKFTITSNGSSINLSGATVAAAIETFEYASVDTLVCDTTLLASGIITVYKTDTTAWPLSDISRPHLLDIKITLLGEIMRTETIGVIVEREITT